MENTKSRLKRLLNESDWTDEDRNWMKLYLKKNDLSELRSLVYSDFEKTLDHIEENISNSKSEKILLNIHKRIDSSKASVSTILYKKLAIAASFILFAAGGYFLVQHIRTGNDINLLMSVSTGQHNFKQLKLVDGTEVWLNANSSLSFPEKFDGKIRKVKLIGEAFFKVKHDASKPFIVVAGNSKTQVLGTSFNINSYNFFKNVKITVSTGKIAVSNTLLSKKPNNPIFIYPNEQAEVSKNSNAIATKKVLADYASGWMEHKLIFDNETLDNVILTLQNNYEITINMPNSKLQLLHFSGKYRASESLVNILDDICLAQKLKWYKKDNQIFLRHAHGNL